MFHKEATLSTQLASRRVLSQLLGNFDCGQNARKKPEVSKVPAYFSAKEAESIEPIFDEQHGCVPRDQ